MLTAGRYRLKENTGAFPALLQKMKYPERPYPRVLFLYTAGEHPVFFLNACEK